MAKTFKAHRSAKNGQFVKESYANKHKNTTVKETVKVGKRKKK